MKILRSPRIPPPYDSPAGARISPCKKFRYLLWRRWGRGKLLVFFMLNPSTADHLKNDQTIKKCMGFAKVFGYDGILVINLFGYRATNPADLAKNGWQDGDDNHMYVEAAMDYARRYDAEVVCAWGAQVRKGLQHSLYDADWVKAQRVQAVALELLTDGIPGHPCMLSYDRKLITL